MPADGISTDPVVGIYEICYREKNIREEIRGPGPLKEFHDSRALKTKKRKKEPDLS